MPAVRVELGYISHAGDRDRLVSAGFQNAVAEAVTAALTTFCAPRT
jgi:N-acetylmuramoyl-L-alanine amidase